MANFLQEQKMKITLSILIALIMVPCAAFSEDEPAQQTNLDKLLDQYEVQQKTSASNTKEDPKSELRRLRNQMIDLRVERDALQEENIYLKNQLEVEQSGDHSDTSDCLETSECVYVDDVENERIISYVIYSLGLYRMAEQAAVNIPQENVEAHRQAQKIMAGVKSDLDVLGFDTTDMTGYPTLDELLQQFQTASGSRATR